MKKLITIIFLTLGFVGVKAQNINNYAFSTVTSASLQRSNGSLIDDIDMTSGTTILIGGSNANTQSSQLAIGFDFWANGARNTTFNVTSNGWVGIGVFVSPTVGWLSNMFSGVKLAPFLGPIITTSPVLAAMGTSAIGRVHYKIIGSAPSRVCVIEFLRMAINTTVVDDYNTFQVRIYEANGSIEYVYGRMKVEVGAPLTFNVGLQFPTALFHSVDVAANTNSTTTNTNYTITSNGFIPSLNNSTPGSQRRYRWLPSPPFTPTNLNFTNITSNSIQLNWTDVSNEIGYAIYRSIDGGATFSFLTQVGANVILYNNTGLPSSTTIYYKVYAIRESLSDPLDGNATTLPPNKIISISSGSWNNTATWQGGVVPTATDSVEISSGDVVDINISGAVAKYLEVNGSLSYANAAASLTIGGDLVINSSGSFTAGAGTVTTHTLSIGGANTNPVSASLRNNGIFDMSTSAAVTVTFGGNQDASISGSGTTNFAGITLNKGANRDAVLNVLGVITMVPPTTATSRLNLTAGTLKISSPSNIVPYYGLSSVVVTNTNSRLWMSNPSASIGMTSNVSATAYGWYCYGEMIIDAGTFNIGNGNHQGFTTTNSGIRMNGGTLNIFGSLSITSIASSYLIVTGGNINIDPQVGSFGLTSGVTPLNIQASSYFEWSGGTITIVDPHTGNNGTSFNIQSASNKFITGGKLRLGDGASGSASSGTQNTSGFAIASSIPIYSLEIDNRIDLSNTRQVRLLNDFDVINLVEIKSNGYLYTGTGATGYNLNINSNFINNGILAGTEPGGSNRLGSLTFDGNSGIQTLSGAGLVVNGNILNIRNTGAGLTFSNTGAWSFLRLNLFRGTVNSGSNLNIGTATVAATIQIGGTDELTPAGTFSSLPNIISTFAYPNYIYGPASSTMTTGSFGEVASGTVNYGDLTIADQEGFSLNRNIIINGTLNLNGGNVSLGSSNLTIGSSITSAGALVRSSGFVNVGTGIFYRWFANGSNPNFTYNSGFPIIVNGVDRSVLLSTNATPLTAGGRFSVKHLYVAGFYDLVTPYFDGGIFVNRRTQSSWVLGTTGFTLGGGQFTVRLNGQGIGTVLNVANLRFVRSLDANAGTNLSGSGTINLPEINRDFSQAQISANQLNDTFYVGVNSSGNPLSPTFIAVANGAWNNPFTWDAAQVPTISNGVIIPAPYTVTFSPSSAMACDSIYIGQGGALSISSNTLSIGKSIMSDGTLAISNGSLVINGSVSNGIDISNTGNLNISGGTVFVGPSGGSFRRINVDGTMNLLVASVTINGNFNVGSTGKFNQSSGELIIDGNSGTASTSVAQGTHLCNFNSSDLNCTGGTITIVDPPHNSYSVSSTQSLRINAGGSVSAFSGTHTFQFGDGVSTEPGNSGGFNVDNRRTGVVPVQNVIINGGSTIGRWVSPSYSAGSYGMYVKGNVTINSNSELRHTSPSQFVIGENLINNGILTAQQPITFGGLGYTLTNFQIVSGSGIFRNSVTSSTASFANVTVDNGGMLWSATGQTYSFSGSLTMVNGIINAGSNVMMINSGASISRTNGFVLGAISRNFSSGTNVSRIYDIGVGSTYTPTNVTFPSITTSGDLVVLINSGDHPQISSSCIDANKSVNRYWQFTNSGVLPSNYNVSLDYLSSDKDPGANSFNFRGQSYNGSIWSNTTLVSATANNIQLSGISGNSAVQVGEYATTNVSVSISATSNNICLSSSVTFTAVPVNGGSSPTYQWKLNGINVGTNSATYITNTMVNGDQVSCQLTSSSICGVVPVSSNVIAMTVSNPTIKGAVSGGGSICSGSSAPLLTLSGYTGSVIRWESANSPYTSWSNINNTVSTFSPGVLTQSTAFRAVVQNGSCPSANADSSLVTVTPGPTGGTVSGSAVVCQGGTSPTLTLSGQSGGSVIRWEYSESPFVIWNSIINTTTTYNPGPVSQTTRYRAIISNGVCQEVASSYATFTVIPNGTWLGITSSDWNNASNWCGGVPTSTTNVSIDPGTPFSPIINTNAFCNNIVVNSGASLTFSGNTNSLDLKGDFQLYGSFNPSNATVIFSGTAFQTIPAVSYNNIIVNGGGSKDIGGFVIVNGTLTLTNGLIVLNNFDLTISSTGAISGGNPASFVITNSAGKLIQNNIGVSGKNGNTLFPIGASSSSYTPATLYNAGTNDNYSARVSDGVYSSYNGEIPSGSLITANVVAKTWFINEAVVGGSLVNLTLQWNLNNEFPSFNRNSCHVARFDGSNWIAGVSGAAVGSNPYSRSALVLTSFSPFGVSENGGPLPVKLLDFYANRVDDKVSVNWRTASEINSYFFEVQRSFDAENFEAIGVVKAAENSKSVLKYNQIDVLGADILKSYHKLYYRLKQVDLDGAFNYSKTIQLDLGSSDNFEILSAFPNPFNSDLNIAFTTPISSEATIRINDAFGKIVLTKSIKTNAGLNNIDISDDSELRSGFYFVTIVQGDFTRAIKIIKN